MALLKIIEWTGSDDDTMVFRYSARENAIERGSRLVVREGQAAIFCDRGRLADVFGPGTYSLDARTIPILTRLMAWRFAFETPYKSDVYFVSTKLFTGLKWGTATPVIVRDKDFGAVRIRAYGNYAVRISDPYVFLTELLGANAEFKASDITDYIRSMLVMGLTDALGESGIPVLDMSANLMELSEAVEKSLGERMLRMGLELNSFIFEAVSFPKDIEKAFDENTRLNMLGKNADVYRKLAEADALREAAKRDSAMGSAMGAMMGLHLGSELTGSKRAHREEPKGSSEACPSCGKQIPAGSKFCPECGSALASFCPECGKKIDPNAKFCPECGKKLS